MKQARIVVVTVLQLLAALAAPVPAVGASLALTLTDQDGAPVNDAVLYISTIDGQHQPSVPQTVEVGQFDQMFVPKVRATTVGSLVNFPNSDHVQHHVYSFSEARTFELPLYSGVPTQPTLFDKAGLVTLGCNIHDHMIGYILVLDTPWFAEVHDGSARIDGLPAGELVIEVWHPLLAAEAAMQRKLSVSVDEAAVLAELVELRPERPERTVRRAPRRSGNRY